MFQHSLNKLIAMVAVSLALASSGVMALPEDREQPIYVAADRASIDDNTGITVYTGNVEITQGSMLLRGDRVELYRNSEGDVDRIVSIGKPALFEQQPAKDQPVTRATGENLDYQVSSQLLKVEGDAKVKQGGDEFTGARIHYDMEQALVDAFSDNSGKTRVRMIIQPRGN